MAFTTDLHVRNTICSCHCMIMHTNSRDRVAVCCQVLKERMLTRRIACPGLLRSGVAMRAAILTWPA